MLIAAIMVALHSDFRFWLVLRISATRAKEVVQPTVTGPVGDAAGHGPVEAGERFVVGRQRRV